MSTAIIINPISGGVASQCRARPGRSSRATSSICAANRWTCSSPKRVGHARELAAAAVRQGARLVMAWGGDGTINEVASALAFSDVPLGIIPAGSGNGLARELGVDPRPERRDRRGPRGRAAPDRRRGDRGPAVRQHRRHRRRRARRVAVQPGDGAAAFSATSGITASALVTYIPTRYRITTGGTRVDARAILVTIANSAQFGNGARIAPGARVDDGLLDLVVVEERWRLATLCQLPRLFTGTVARMRGCTIRRIREVIVEADQPMTFHVDGEPVVGGTRLTRGCIRGRCGSRCVTLG